MTLFFIIIVAAAIPAVIAYSAVRITLAEQNGTRRGLFMSFVVISAKIGAVLVLIAVFLFVWVLGAFNGTNVAFQSSDGKWADSEVLFKDRDFEVILVSFELYRAKCSSQAQLQRTTPKPNWYEYNNWFNNYASPKWHVPYRPALQNARNGYHPPLSEKHCANNGYTKEEINAAHERAMQFMSRIAP